MPFKKTDKGWFWGSKGPFPSKSKAVQVARAAYASGYKEEAGDAMDCVKFSAGLLHGVTNAHILHLRADTFAIHEAMGEFYTSLEDLTDSFIEAYQGKYDKIMDYGTEYNPPDDDALTYMQGFLDWIELYRQQIPQDTYLQNIVDEITQSITSTLNKLRFYK